MIRRLLKKFNINLPSLPSSPPTHAPDRQTLIQLAVIIAIALALHFTIAKSTIAVFSCVVYAIKCTIIWRRSNALPQWLVMILTVTSIGLIITSYGGWNGQTAGISFLVLLVSLKFLESQTVRDYFIVCLILYFLAASSFLFNSSLPNIILIIAYTAAITALLFKITNPAEISSYSALKSSSGLILKSIPLALFLFFFFPRVQGSFGFLPSLDQATNSLNDSLVAGDMASNAFSNELAFKAQFDGPIPPTSRLYWRVKVMNEEVNFAWQSSSDENLSLPNQRLGERLNEAAELSKGETYYDILHEPSRDVYVPYLDFVKSHSIGRLTHDYSVRLRRPNRGSFIYQGSSTLLPYLENEERSLAFLTSTQSQPTARLQALLSRLRRNAKSDLELATATYNYFSANEYNYSLSPPGLDDDTPLDDFLFNTKTGYCEHYASAYTTLLRWLGVPARVVVGYHGGTINKTGNFVEVRYSDAHAWSEAYINGSWVRFDPTSTISPERIEYGMDALRELWGDGQLGRADGNALSDFLNPTGTALVWKTMVETWSNVQYQWKKWVVEYDFETQQELLAKLGLQAKNSLYSLVAILSAGVFGILIFYFWQLIPKPAKLTDVQRSYLRFVAKAARAGVNRSVSDTPSEFANKVIRRYPNAKSHVESITRIYLSLSYRAPSLETDKQLAMLKDDVKKLKLKRANVKHDETVSV